MAETDSTLNDLFSQCPPLSAYQREEGFKECVAEANAMALALCAAPANDLQAVLRKIDVLAYFATTADPYEDRRLGIMLATIRDDVERMAPA